MISALAALGLAALGLAALGLVLVAWMLARRRQAEEARLTTERHLAHAQKMEAVGRLAGGLAHDVNNYLATIRAHAELVAQRDLSPAQVREKMKLIEQTVLKASSLLERLLTFARRQPIRPERVDLNDVVADFEALVAGSLPPGVELRLELGAELPAVEIDLAEADQVLANLFVNAKDALTGPGCITVSTRAGQGADGEPRVELLVRDTGRGIPGELLGQIFEPFFTTKSGHGSSGLGLATVEAIVTSAGGKVSVESRPGEGTTFRVVLPVAPPRVEPAVVPPPSAVLQPGEASILLVDDNAELAAAIAAQLTGRGFRVATFGTAEEALAAAHQGARWDLVITDVQLPGLMGTELVKALRQQMPIRGLYMSGYTDRISLRRGAGAAEAYFLKKPFSGEGLARMVEELLARPVDTMAR